MDVPDSETNWQTWVDGLNEDDTQKLHGTLAQKFGRLDLEQAPHDSRAYTHAYLSRLEAEFSDWLCRPREVIDYVLASRHEGFHVNDVDWQWLHAHQQMWRFRGRRADAEPSGIRLLPLVETSLERVVSRRLGASIAEFFRSVAERPKEAKEWVVYVEDGCAQFDRSIPDLLGDSWIAFQSLQNCRGPVDIDPHLSCRDALNNLKQLKAHLPDTIYETYQATLENLGRALETYRPKPKEPAANRPTPFRHRRKVHSDIDDRNSHFLNNWD